MSAAKRNIHESLRKPELHLRKGNASLIRTEPRSRGDCPVDAVVVVIIGGGGAGRGSSGRRATPAVLPPSAAGQREPIRPDGARRVQTWKQVPQLNLRVESCQITLEIVR